jgi:ureidoglycolate lyase
MTEKSRLPKRLSVVPLTVEAFAPYGDVIDGAGALSFVANGGAAFVHRDLARVDVGAFGGRVCVSWVQTAPRPLPIDIKVMERHALGSQAFVPLDGARLLTIVAPGGDFDANAIIAFLGAPSQGVNYKRGVWHHPLVALDRESKLVILDREGAGENLELITLGEPWVIENL